MNFFLHINKRLIFFLGLVILVLFILLILSKQFNYITINPEKYISSISNVDIEQPKFFISNESKKIYITANEGNFLDDNKILLNKNVRFESNDFSIETEKVIFNRIEQTAKSNSKSLFTAENTTISSDGFNIIDKGGKIVFHGNSLVTLK